MKRKTPREKIEKQTAHLPNPLAYFALSVVVRLLARIRHAKFVYDFDVSEFEDKQIILISDHASTETYLYTLAGYTSKRFNTVIGKEHLYKRFLTNILLSAGCIPKSLFEPDVKSTKIIMSVIGKGGNILLFPEGVQSSNGGVHPINPTTAKMLKRANLPIILCKSYGSYLVYPRYNEERRKGHHEYHYELLFTPEELEKMSVEEIDDKLIERFSYNDFDWNKKHGYEYEVSCGNAKGIDGLLYKCPKCGAEFKMHTEGKDLVCECGNRIRIHNNYKLEAIEDGVMPYSDIVDWHFAERDSVAEEIKNPNFTISYECDLAEIIGDRVSKDLKYVSGHGVLTISPETLIYMGTRNGEKVVIEFEICKIPCFLWVPNVGNKFYYNGELFEFRPTYSINKAMKYQFIVEEFHNLQDGRWRKALDNARKKYE